MKKLLRDESFYDHTIKKSLRIMRITLFLSFVSILQVFAVNSFSQKNTISLKMERSRIIEVLNEIENQSQFRFIYGSNTFDEEKKVSVNLEKGNIEDVLEQVFLNSSVTYKIIDRQIVLSANNANQNQADKKVTGSVTSSDGEPLPGVSIVIKGTTTGTITGPDGNYALDVPANAKALVFSFIGMKTKEVAVGNKTLINVVLEDETLGIDEVVVVGYGSVKKSDLTGSISSVKLDDSQNKGVTSFEQILQGRLAGVQITQNTGDVGAGITFNIRGMTNLGGSSQPLIVVDGYPINSESIKTGDNETWLDGPSENPLADLNPGDIESIDVLKDASSIAIYGSRATNGVVIITTKKGKKEKTSIDYSYDASFGQVAKHIDVLNTEDYITYRNIGHEVAGMDSAYNLVEHPELLDTDINWQDLIFRTSMTNTHQLSLKGANETSRYALSIGYLDQEGIVLGSNYERGSMRLNFDRQVLPKLNVGLNASILMSSKDAVAQSGTRDIASASIIRGVLRTPPLNRAFTDEELINTDLQGNPLTMVTLATDKNDNFVVRTSLFAEYDITDELRFKVMAGINDSKSQRNLYHPRGTFLGNRDGGVALKGYGNAFNYLTDATLTYNSTINDKHSINAVVGYSWQEWSSNSFRMWLRGFPNDSQKYYDLTSASTIDSPVTGYSKSALSSFLGRAVYSYDGRYLLTLTARYDGSTRLAPGQKWAFFPSVGLGWNVHKEQFMKEIDAISNLKLRASYGLSGRQSIGIGSTKAFMNSTTGVYNQEVTIGYFPSNIANGNLHWETTTQLNAGMDLGLFKNKLDFSFDYYVKTTTDLLIGLNIPLTNGFGSYNTNAGEIENKGFEVSLGGSPFSGDFSWDVSGNFSVNKNTILDLGAQSDFFVGGAHSAIGGQSLNISMVGESIGAFYGYRVDGIYQNQEEIDNGPFDPESPKPGDFKFKDISGPDGVPDGEISQHDREIIGNPFPDFIFGLNNNISYKNVSLSFLIQGSIGQEVANGNRYFMDALAGQRGPNVRQEAYDNRWTGEGTSNYYPRISGEKEDPFNARFSDFIVEDASFVRLKSANLSYDVDVKQISYLKSLRVYVAGTNLLTFTNYKGYDPEVNSRGGSRNIYGLDFGSIPQYRTFSVGVKVGF